MKTQIIIITALSAHFAMCEDDEHYLSRMNPLPLQAAVCDVIGIGALESQTDTNVVINVSQYWFGDLQTNVINVKNSIYSAFPSGGTNFLFFLTKWILPEGDDFIADGYTHDDYQNMFDMADFRSKYRLDAPLRLHSLMCSRIPVITNNADLISWCSNLVYTSQISLNRQAFYELIRDGYRLNPESSRIHRESRYAFDYASYFMSTNFMQQAWSDTNLTGLARARVDDAYWMMTRLRFDWPSSE